jgi:hypothetical protein
VLISLGIAGLVWTFWESISTFLAGASLDAALMTAQNSVSVWWSLTITPGITYLDGLEPNSPAYVVLLISAALGILLFPILIYALNKLVHRLFP